jgi:hypothetical protein
MSPVKYPFSCSLARKAETNWFDQIQFEKARRRHPFEPSKHRMGRKTKLPAIPAPKRNSSAPVESSIYCVENPQPVSFPKMRYIAIFLLAFIFLTGTSAAQCELSLNESPGLVNVRLGMTPEEVNAALGGSVRVKVKNDNQQSYFKSFLKKGKAKGVLTGARAFYLRFFESQVYQIEIFYHKDFKWNNLEAFLRDYSLESGFASDNFVTKYGYSTAKCKGFTIRADYKLNPHLEITDQAAKERVELAKKKKGVDDGTE